MRIENLGAVGVFLGAIALNMGCAARLEGGAQADAPVVFTSDPTLVEVDSGVWVVRDYDYPVYYVNDDYWVIREGVWYRSNSYDRGWTRVEVNVVPAVIVSRDHRAYVHYHGVATAQSRVAPRRGPGDHHGDDHHGDDHHADEHHDGKPEEHHDGKPEEHRGDDHHEARPEEHRAEEHHENKPEEHHENAPDPNKGKKRGGDKDKDKKDKKR